MRSGWRRGTTIAAVLLGAAGRAFAAGPTLAWSITVDGAGSPDDGATAIAVDAGGDAIVGGALAHQLAVVKRSGATGAAVWQSEVAGAQGSTKTTASAVAAHGDGVFAAGMVANGSSGTDFTVIKLRDADGTVVWKASLEEGAATGLAVDHGHIVTSGTRDGHFTVIQLAGGSGNTLWKYSHGNQLSPPLVAWTVAMNSAGDVVAGGWSERTGPAAVVPHVALLDGSSGSALWSRSFASQTTGLGKTMVAVMPLDHVLLAANDADRVRVRQLNPLDGSEESTWTSPASSFGAASVFHDEALFVAGTRKLAAGGTDLLVLKLVYPAPCKKGDPSCGCNPPCQPHRYCVGHTCRTVEPAQPGGPMHKD